MIVEICVTHLMWIALINYTLIKEVTIYMYQATIIDSINALFAVIYFALISIGMNSFNYLSDE
jgi:hypothetical protein